MSVLYTIDGNRIIEGYGGPVVYTIDGNRIIQGYGGPVVYTIDGNRIVQGYGGPVVYTIDGNRIVQGYGGPVVYTIDDNRIYAGYGSGGGGYSGGYSGGGRKPKSPAAKLFSFIWQLIVIIGGAIALFYITAELRVYGFNTVASILLYGCGISTVIALFHTIFRKGGFGVVANAVGGWAVMAVIALVICAFFV